MWHTSKGERTLHGAEAALVRAGIDVLIDRLLISFDEHFEDDPTDDYPSGVSMFDSLTPAQRVGSLYDVAQSLLTETGAAPATTAVKEATVAAVFLEIQDQVAIEIDFFSEPSDPAADQSQRHAPPKQNIDPDQPSLQQESWRSLVLNAYHEVQSDQATDDPEQCESVDAAEPRDFSANSDQMEEWKWVIDGLSDKILWDRDFEMADLFMDADPEIAKKRRQLLGIGSDYFTEVVEDPRPAEVAKLVAATRDLVRRKPR